MTFALFAFNIDSSGGVNDLYGRYETRELAEQSARDNRDAWDFWQLIELPLLGIVWEKTRWELSPCNGKNHKWRRWQKIRKVEDAPDATFGCLLTWEWIGTKTATLERKCARCGERQDNGVHPPIFPAMPPLTNLMPRVNAQPIPPGIKLTEEQLPTASGIPPTYTATALPVNVTEWPDLRCAK